MTHVRSIPDFPIKYGRLRESLLLMQEQFVALTEQVSSAQGGARSNSKAATSVSNRNDAHAYRNRIFLRSRYQIFVDATLQQPASPRESRCEANDSQSDSIRSQTPRRFLSASLTACGFAFPPVDFITGPTNQPNMPGFALACSAFSGLAA